MLVSIVGAAGGPAIIVELLTWLHELDPKNQRSALLGLMRAVGVAQNSPAKAATIAAISQMSEEDADALANSHSDIRLFLHQFAGLSSQTRRRLIAGNFFCAIDREGRRQ